MKANNKINIEFTPEQFENLLKLVYLGEWMMNSNNESDEVIEEFEEIHDYMFSQASKQGFKNLVQTDTDTGKVFPSVVVEEEMLDFIEEYDNETFWDELCERLALRDALKIHSMEALGNMNVSDRLKILMDLDQYYRDKFAEDNLDNVRI